jgi:hypothetical protein
MTGQPQIVNRIGALDVDIIIDEGPDTVTMMADALETLQGAMANGTPVPAEVIYELLPVPDSMKKRLIGITQQAQQPNPAQQQAAMIELKQGAANVEKTQSETAKNMAQAQQAMQPEQPNAPDSGPTFAEIQDTLASAEQKHSSAILNMAKAEETRVKTVLAPAAMAQKASADRAKAQQWANNANS